MTNVASDLAYDFMNSFKLRQQTRQISQRNLGWPVRKGDCRVVVSLNENAIAARRDSSSRQNGRQLAIPPARTSRPAGALDRVRGIEDDGISEFSDPVERSHVSNQVVVAKSYSSFGEDVLAAPKGL